MEMQTSGAPTEALGQLLQPGFFKALCDPTRVAILTRMCAGGGARTVGQIAEGCTVDVSVVSRHLATLRDAGILAAERSGKTVRYRVRWQQVVGTLRGLADALESCCAYHDPGPPSV